MKYSVAVMLTSIIVLIGCISSPSPETGMLDEIPDGMGNGSKNVDMLDTPTEFEVTIQEVNYFEQVSGYLAKPKGEASYPGVVMIHEWWGLNDNIKTMARQLAGEGYTVLAVDLYDGQVATDSAGARELVTGLDAERAVANMRAATTYLREQEQSEKLASLGWCFGGGQSLQLALSGETMDATVIYYGSLVTEEESLRTIEWPVLGIFGSADTSIPVEEVDAFGAALDQIGVMNSIHVYDGVGHAFANPSGSNYAPEETMDAWEKTVQFLETQLK